MPALQVLADLGIRLDVDEAEHEARRICREFVAKALHLFDDVLDRELVRENERIKPPDHAILADTLREPLECLDTRGERGHPQLDSFGVVVVQRELEVVVGADYVEVVEVRDHRRGILRPEHDTAHLPEADVERHAIERIEPLDVPGLKPFHE